MTTELARRIFPVDAKTGLTLPLSRSLGSQELAQHRAMVAVELEVMAKKLDRFGWERDRGSMAHDRIVTDWMDALQDYPLDEVKAACASWILKNPRRMPNEGDIRAEIQRARADILARQPKPATVTPERDRVSPDAAAQIMAEAGFAPKRFGGDT